MDKDLRIKIKIDSETAKLDTLNTKINSTAKGFNQADSMAATFLSRLSFGAGAVGGLYLVADTLLKIKDRGFEVNKEVQKLTNSLTTSSAVMMANTDIYGNAITVADKYKLAQIDARRSTELLQKANLNTPHVMNQTVQIYDSMYYGMRKVGATTKDMVEITEKLSIATGNKIGFDSFLAAMDGISTGTVEANSEMGRFLSAIGLSNDEIKNSADVVQLFKDRLSDFQAISDFDTKMSNLNNNIDIFSKNVMKMPFDYMESKLDGISSIVEQMNRGLVRTIVSFSNVSSLSEKNDLILKRQQLLQEKNDIKNDKFMFDSEQKTKITDINKELSLLSQKLAKIYQDEDKLANIGMNFDSAPIDKLVNDTLNPYGAKLDEINKKWQTYFQDMQKNGKDVSGVINAWTKNITDLDKEFADKNRKETTANKKSANELKRSLDDRLNQYSNYYSATGDFSNLWEIEEQKLRENNTELTKTELKKLIEIKKQAFDKEHQIQKEVMSADDWKSYYETIGDYSTSWLLEEADLYSQYSDLNETEFKKIHDIAKREYFDKFKKQTEEIETTADRVFKSLYQSADDFFFSKWESSLDKLFNKFGDFGNILQDTLSPIGHDISSELASYITPVANNVTRVDTNLLSAKGFTQSKDGSWVNESSSGTIKVASNGVVTTGASLLSGDLGTALNLATLPNTLSKINAFASNPSSFINSAIYAPSASLGGLSSSLMAGGYTNAGMFAAGGANWLGGTSALAQGGSYGNMALAGNMATGALVGGVGGYALGSLGDSLFGADTKAGNFGAIGGAIGGAVGGPIGALIGAGLGSVIGGFFGSTKSTDSGLYSSSIISQDSVNAIQSYIDYKKKSWFSSKSWTEYKNIDEKTRRALESTFDTMNSIADVLNGVTNSNISLSAGKYSGQNLLEVSFPKALLEEVMGYLNEDIYNLWVDYAESINTTVLEAMQDGASSYRQTIRTYELYTLDTDLEKLKKQYEYAQSDYELLAKTAGADLGRLTIENFTSYYQRAIKEDFTAETIDMWENLGDALLQADESLNSYNQELENQAALLKQSEIEFSNYMQTLSSSLEETLSLNFNIFIDNLNKIGSTLLTLSSSTSAAINNIKSSSFNDEDSIIAFNKLRREIDGYFEGTSTLSEEDLTSKYNSMLSFASNISESSPYLQDELLNYLENNLLQLDEKEDIIKVSIIDGLGDLLGFNSEIVNQLKEVVKDGLVTNSELSNLSSFSGSSYLELLSLNQNGLNVTDAQLKSLQTVSEAQKAELIKANVDGIITNSELVLIKNLSGLNYSELLSLNTNGLNVTDAQLKGLQTLSEAQKAELIKANVDGLITNSELKVITGLSKDQIGSISTVANNTSFLSTEQTLTAVETLAQEQLKALKMANEEQSEKLSSKTLQYGDSIGKQEQIDIAKLLGVSYETAQPLIENLQALSISKNPLSDMKSLLGYEDGSTSYDTATANQIKSLSPYLETDITSSLSNIETSVKNKILAKEDFYNRYEVALDKYETEKTQSDQARDLYAQKWQTAFRGWRDDGHLVEENFESGRTLAHTKYWYDAYSIGNVSPYSFYKLYATEFQQARSAYQILQTLENEKKLNGFMYGTSNMLDDQLAMFNQREIVVPTSFSDGVRNGDLSLGNNKEIIKAIEEQTKIVIAQAREIQQMKDSINEMNTRDLIKTAKGVA